jgi:hypothetical protein
MKRCLLWLALAAMLGCSSTLPPEAQHYRTACDQGDQRACLDYENLAHNQEKANTQNWYFLQYGTVPSMSTLGPDNTSP